MGSDVWQHGLLDPVEQGAQGVDQRQFAEDHVLRRIRDLGAADSVVQQIVDGGRHVVDARLDEVRAGDQRFTALRRFGDDDASLRHRLDRACPLEVGRVLGAVGPGTVDVEQQLR